MAVKLCWTIIRLSPFLTLTYYLSDDIHIPLTLCEWKSESLTCIIKFNFQFSPPYGLLLQRGDKFSIFAIAPQKYLYGAIWLRLYCVTPLFQAYGVMRHWLCHFTPFPSHKSRKSGWQSRSICSSPRTSKNPGWQTQRTLSSPRTSKNPGWCAQLAFSSPRSFHMQNIHEKVSCLQDTTCRAHVAFATIFPTCEHASLAEHFAL